MKTVKLNNLQVLRGFAALMICVHHCRFLVNIPNENSVLDSFRGAIGVPMFFIISGFIMVHSTRKITPERWLNAKEFIIKRLIRIVPLLYFAIAGLLLIYHHEITRYFTTGLPMLLKTMFFIPLFTDTSGPAYGFSFMYVSWSLNYEMLFYALFAFSMFFARYRYHFIYMAFFLFAFIAPVLLKGRFSFDPGINYGFGWKYMNFLSNPILLLFLLGVTFGLIIRKVEPDKKLMYGFSLVCCGVFGLYFLNIIPSFTASDIIVCGALVFALLLLDYNSEKIRPPRWLVYMGDISYSIYLMHPLVFIYLSNFVKQRGLTGIESSWYFAVFGILVVIAVSAVTYELIEKRFTNFLRKKLLEPPFRKPSAVLQPQ